MCVIVHLFIGFFSQHNNDAVNKEIVIAIAHEPVRRLADVPSGGHNGSNF